MKKALWCIGLLALICSTGWASALVTPEEPVYSGVQEWYTYEIYDYIVNTYYGGSRSDTSNSDLDSLQMTDDELYSLIGSEGSVTAHAHFALFNNTFGWYDSTTLIETPMFSVTTPYEGILDPTAHTFVLAPSADTFGFFDRAHGETWYSDSARNENGEDHLAVYRIPGFANTYALFWEDLPFTDPRSDRDYNDLVMTLSLGQVIPEPATVLLLGLGLAGLGLQRFRKS